MSNNYDAYAMELYHLLNRGVDKRAIFLNDRDRQRFVAGLELFNDTNSVDNIKRMLSGDTVRHTMSNTERHPLVCIHGWCLMKNHYHLLVSEVIENGISKFIQKLNMGFSKYFNTKHKRSGALFQGRTKKVLIASDAHFLHILHYIHFNPLDHLKETRSWRDGKIFNHQQALAYLESYPWSSYLDYCGEENFPSLLTTDLFKNEDVFKDYKKAANKYLRDIDISDLKPLTLE